MLTNPIFWYVISVIISLPLLLLAAKNDFGYVTIGGLIPLTFLSLIPLANIPLGIVLLIASSGKANEIWGSIISKRIL